MRDRTSRLSGFVLPYPTVKLQGTIIRFKSATWPARLWARSPLLCGLGSIRGPGVTWRLSFWLVLVHALFHLVDQFSSPCENQHSNFKFDLETMDKKSHLVESPPLNSSYNYHYYFAFDNDNPSSVRGAHIWIRFLFLLSGESCDGLTCEYHDRCVNTSHGYVECRCPQHTCPNGREIICGTDGKTYLNMCVMRKEVCRVQKRIEKKHEGRCSGKKFLF